MTKKKILIFPCGSEVGLEINRSLKYSRHFEIWGGSSIDDHGKYVFENYIDGIPFITDSSFIYYLKAIVNKYSIDAIYPAMDNVLTILKDNEDLLTCKVIGSLINTTRICQSKEKTYSVLKDVINIPKMYKNEVKESEYPVFMKPNMGYGSIGARKINNKDELIAQKNEYQDSLIQEYLPGYEYTVDCFTDRKGNLLFIGPRERRRVRMGISVNTRSIERKEKEEFEKIAFRINSSIKFRGAWFFQVKRDKNHNLKLLEVASRIGGSTGVFRAKGINLALLSVWDVFDIDVEVIKNELVAEMDRAFDCKFNIKYEFEIVYVDFDDCLLIDMNKVNYELVGLLYKFINEGKKIILLTRHIGNITETLNRFRLLPIFDKIIHIKQEDKKSTYIQNKKSILIDDSFGERSEVFHTKGIPVFPPECLF